MSPMGISVLSSGASAAVSQLPSNVGGPLADDKGTPANPISLEDSMDEDSGSATVSKVNNNNNEIVSFYLLLFSLMYMDV